MKVDESMKPLKTKNVPAQILTKSLILKVRAILSNSFVSIGWAYSRRKMPENTAPPRRMAINLTGRVNHGKSLGLT